MRQSSLPNPEIDCQNLLSITEQKTRKNYLGIRISKSLSSSRRWNEAQIQDIRALLHAAQTRRVEALVILCPHLKEDAEVQILPAQDALREALDTYSTTEEAQSVYWTAEHADILKELTLMPQPHFQPISSVTETETGSVAYRSIVKVKDGKFYIFASATSKDHVKVMPLGHSKHRHNLKECACSPFAVIDGDEWNLHAPVSLSDGRDSHRMIALDVHGNIL